MVFRGAWGIELLADRARHLADLHDSVHEHDRIGHQVRGRLHERRRRNDEQRSHADGQRAALHDQAGDRRTAHRSDRHRSRQRELQSERLDARQLQRPERAVVFRGAWGARASRRSRVATSPTYTTPSTSTTRSGHQVRGGLHERRRRNDDRRSDADGQRAAVRRAPGDHRTAQSPDGHRSRQRELQSRRLDARQLQRPERAVVFRGAWSAQLLADRRRHLADLHDAAHEHGAERHQVRGGLHERLRIHDDRRSDADGQRAAVRRAPGDHRTAQSPDGHRSRQRELQSRRLDARQLQRPERAVVFRGAWSARASRRSPAPPRRPTRRRPRARRRAAPSSRRSSRTPSNPRRQKK